jgi:tellurite resistance protein TehA-like permease
MVTVDVAAALFWVNLPAVVLCIVLIPFSMFAVHDHGMQSMTAVWLVPVVPATMAAHTAGLMAQNVPEVKFGGVLIFMGESDCQAG